MLHHLLLLERDLFWVLVEPKGLFILLRERYSVVRLVLCLNNNILNKSNLQAVKWFCSFN